MESGMAISSVTDSYSDTKPKSEPYTYSGSNAYSITESKPYANSSYTSYWSSI
jgi:hypothetical protein